jgi:acetoin utilization protein AcuA
MGGLLTADSEDSSSFIHKTVILETPKGALEIHSNCPTGFFAGLTFDPGLGRFAAYSSIIQKIDAFEAVAAKRGGKVALALMQPNLVVGYNVCWYPEEDERWSALGDLMYEMAAVEVSRNFRSLRIAGRMLETTLDDDFFNDKIAYMNGYSWHWDLEGSGLTAIQYRKMMMELYSPFGFREVYTNEPNIALRAENIMMIRVGENVMPEDQRRFRYLRFGIVEGTKKSNG